MLILSIKPRYVERILDRSKRVEFRKSRLKSPEKLVFIYASSPRQEVVGYFRYKTIIEDSPKKIWEKYKEIGGICEDDFFQYYKGKQKAFAIEISEVKTFPIPVKPSELERFTPPQSFQYVDVSRWKPLALAMQA